MVRRSMRYALTISIIGLVITFLIYDKFVNLILISKDVNNTLDTLNILFYIMLITSLSIIITSTYNLLKRSSNIYIRNVLYILNNKKYITISIISFIGYAIFYSLLSGIIVYSEEPLSSLNIEIPSSRIVARYVIASYMPVYAVYITNHFGLLIVPLNIIFLIVISSLVALNISITKFIYDNKPKNVSRSWLSTFGATIGLFTSCPACASAFFFSPFFGLSSSILAIILPLQPLLIAISIPILILSSVLMLRQFSRCEV
ncbi:MAG: hypothetical protein QXK74_05705 [Candidatus Nitrosocaldaceae archaeon]